jgi:hypothetical protein
VVISYRSHRKLINIFSVKLVCDQFKDREKHRKTKPPELKTSGEDGCIVRRYSILYIHLENSIW